MKFKGVMKLNSSTVSAAVAVIALLITIGTGIYQLGKLSAEMERLSAEVERLPTREEIRILIAEEIRRSNQQLLYSLVNHTHDADGNAVFTIPPGMEPTGANPNQLSPAQ